MADTTNDFWPEEGEEKTEQRSKPSRKRHFLIFALALVAVLGVVLAAAWKDGSGFNLLHRHSTYDEEDGQNGVFHYDASVSNRFAAVGDGLVVLSGTSLEVLDQEGHSVWSTPVKMDVPAVSAGGGLAVAYDVGGTALYVVGPEGLKMQLSANPDEPIIAATLNASGYLAVTSEKQNAKACATVYDAAGGKNTPIFVFKSSKRFLMDAYVTDDCKNLAAVTLGQENGVFVSRVVLYDLTKKEPEASYDIADGLVLAIGEQDGLLVTVSDTALTYGTVKGEIRSTYTYRGAFLRGYDISGSGYTALLLNRYQAGSAGRLMTISKRGEEIAVLDVNEEILDISAAGHYLAVLYRDQLVVYNEKLQVYATLDGTKFARNVVAYPNGSALLIGSEQAYLFLP